MSIRFVLGYAMARLTTNFRPDNHDSATNLESENHSLESQGRQTHWEISDCDSAVEQLMSRLEEVVNEDSFNIRRYDLELYSGVAYVTDRST